MYCTYSADDPNAPVLGEEEILAAKVVAAEQAEAMVKALDAAIPRACMVKAHARKVAATRHIGEGGQALSLGAADRWVSALGNSFSLRACFDIYRISGEGVCTYEALFDLVMLIAGKNGMQRSYPGRESNTHCCLHVESLLEIYQTKQTCRISHYRCSNDTARDWFDPRAYRYQ